MGTDISEDYTVLLDILPPFIVDELTSNFDMNLVDEIIIDIGRNLEIRHEQLNTKVDSKTITYEDIDFVVSQISDFNDDNRAGIDKTLHRISALRNRKNRIIGLTIRVGRAVSGVIDVIKDLLDLNTSALLMGPPGIGKTTKLREVARILSLQGKRVVVVDTSNEIAGEGDIPHEGIGDARRLQVPQPSMQHKAMIEAVENHMPEVIVVDEIGTELEARAARTIAERGVQLIATAHGQTLNNLIKNPTLCDLVGGVESATLSDEEAKRRGTQKTILERVASPTFETLVELKDRNTLHCFRDVAMSVDHLLSGKTIRPEIRIIKENGDVETISEVADEIDSVEVVERGKTINVFPFAINRARLETCLDELGLTCTIANKLIEATIMLTTKSMIRKNKNLEDVASENNIPIYVVKTGSTAQLTKFLRYYFDLESDQASEAMPDVDAIVMSGMEDVERLGTGFELPPANSYVRRYQHRLLSSYGYESKSMGSDVDRRVKIIGKLSE